MIVMIFMASLSGHWGVAIKTYPTIAECTADLAPVQATYKRKYPQALLWCSEPIGYSGV